MACSTIEAQCVMFQRAPYRVDTHQAVNTVFARSEQLGQGSSKYFETGKDRTRGEEGWTGLCAWPIGAVTHSVDSPTTARVTLQVSVRVELLGELVTSRTCKCTFFFRARVLSVSSCSS